MICFSNGPAQVAHPGEAKQFLTPEEKAEKDTDA